MDVKASTGFIPTLTRIIFKSVWTGAAWVTEAIVTYCETLVQTGIAVILAVLAGTVLVHFGISWHVRPLVILGVFIGGASFVVFAIVASPLNLGLDALGTLGAGLKREIDRVSNIIFAFILTLFYVSVTEASNHPILLAWFLGIVAVLYGANQLPGENKLASSFKNRFQWIILIPITGLVLATVLPEAVLARIENGHLTERLTNTIPSEVFYRLDSEERLVDAATGRPIEFFDQIADGQSGQPKATKGWTKDRKNHHHLYAWFEHQNNFTATGQKIEPITAEKIEDIITEQKAAAEKQLKAQQAEAAAKSAEAAAKAAADIEADKKEIPVPAILPPVETTPPVIRVETILEVSTEHDKIGSMVFAKLTEPFVFSGHEFSTQDTRVSLQVRRMAKASKEGLGLIELEPIKLEERDRHEGIYYPNAKTIRLRPGDRDAQASEIKKRGKHVYIPANYRLSFEVKGGHP